MSFAPAVFIVSVAQTTHCVWIPSLLRTLEGVDSSPRARSPARAQVGKSGASWITQALLLGCGSISRAMPATAAIFGVVVASFFVAVNGLRREMVVRPHSQKHSILLCH